jgi:RNA polymerase sigma factor (sigma-70 family)
MADMGQTIAMTDGELLEASRRGERDAFGVLVERYQHVVCAITYSRTRNQALSEDVAQDTFIAAWKQLDQLREPGRLRSWLCGIARNLARKARRRSDRETPVEEPIVAAAGESPFDAVSEAQAERVVGEALSRVPESYRDVLVLYYREQRSVREVAAALGISEAATLQRLARGRHYLASGVTSLVEKSLRAQRRPRRDLVVGVVAALPPMAVSFRVEASTANPARSSPDRLGSTVSHGGSMLKLAIAAVVVSAAGTTAYVVHDSRGSAPAAATAPARTAAAEIAPAAPAALARIAPAPGPSLPTPAPAAAPAAGEPEDPPCKDCKGAPPPEGPQVVSAEAIARLGLERGPSRGAATAPVTIVAFTDMKCKFCGAALGVLDQLLEEYDGKIRMVVKQRPISPKHEVLSQGLYAAEAQGKFWELHDLMLAHQDELSKDTMLALAPQAGLDADRLRAALEDAAVRAKLDADVAAATELEINGTPTFFINGQRVSGLRSPDDFRKVIDRALAARR